VRPLSRLILCSCAVIPEVSAVPSTVGILGDGSPSRRPVGEFPTAPLIGNDTVVIDNLIMIYSHIVDI
jgi:hypothetical protein